MKSELTCVQSMNKFVPQIPPGLERFKTHIQLVTNPVYLLIQLGVDDSTEIDVSLWFVPALQVVAMFLQLLLATKP